MRRQRRSPLTRLGAGSTVTTTFAFNSHNLPAHISRPFVCTLYPQDNSFIFPIEVPYTTSLSIPIPTANIVHNFFIFHQVSAVT